MSVTNLEGRADFDVLAALHGVDLTDQEAGDARVLVHHAVHAAAHLDQRDDAGRGVAQRRCGRERSKGRPARTVSLKVFFPCVT